MHVHNSQSSETGTTNGAVVAVKTEILDQLEVQTKRRRSLGYARKRIFAREKSRSNSEDFECLNA